MPLTLPPGFITGMSVVAGDRTRAREAADRGDWTENARQRPQIRLHLATGGTVDIPSNSATIEAVMRQMREEGLSYHPSPTGRTPPAQNIPLTNPGRPRDVLAPREGLTTIQANCATLEMRIAAELGMNIEPTTPPRPSLERPTAWTRIVNGEGDES